jgi:hypothetical protein
MAQGQTGKMSAGERLTAKLLRWLPWLAFAVCALPLPAYFLYQYFTAAENVGEQMLFALTSLGVGSLVGLLAALFVVLYRGRWEKRLRERLASDGVTADELSWFASELTPAQRRALKEMEAQNPLLADAYRETLAARVTAVRVLAAARRDSEAVGRRFAEASRLQSAGRAALEEDLRKDRSRLERILRETNEHHAEIETRLHTIEALASRRASEAETEVALLRLGAVRAHTPLTLESARAESEAREEVEQELRDKLAQHQRDLASIEKGLRESATAGDEPRSLPSPQPPDKI